MVGRIRLTTFTILNKRLITIKVISVFAMIILFSPFIPMISAQNTPEELNEECRNLVLYANEKFNKLIPIEKQQQSKNLFLIPPLNLNIPSLIIEGKKFDKNNALLLSEVSRNLFFPTPSLIYSNGFLNIMNHLTSPSFTLYQLQEIKIAYLDKSPFTIKLSLEYIDPKTAEVVKVPFSQVGPNVYMVPAVEPERCYLLVVDLTGSSIGNNKIFNSLFWDLVKVEEP